MHNTVEPIQLNGFFFYDCVMNNRIARNVWEKIV